MSIVYPFDINVYRSNIDSMSTDVNLYIFYIEHMTMYINPISIHIDAIPIRYRSISDPQFITPIP